MLTGQVIGFFDSVRIALMGIAIVMLELGMLSLLVTVMSKLTAFFTDKKNITKAAAPGKDIFTAALPISSEELAVLVSAVCETTGLAPHQLNIKSIITK